MLGLAVGSFFSFFLFPSCRVTQVHLVWSFRTIFAFSLSRSSPMPTACFLFALLCVMTCAFFGCLTTTNILLTWRGVDLTNGKAQKPFNEKYARRQTDELRSTGRLLGAIYYFYSLDSVRSIILHVLLLGMIFQNLHGRRGKHCRTTLALAVIRYHGSL